jgi:hypothetical protein
MNEQLSGGGGLIFFIFESRVCTVNLSVEVSTTITPLSLKNYLNVDTNIKKFPRECPFLPLKKLLFSALQ